MPPPVTRRLRQGSLVLLLLLVAAVPAAGQALPEGPDLPPPDPTPAPAPAPAPRPAPAPTPGPDAGPAEPDGPSPAELAQQREEAAAAAAAARAAEQARRRAEAARRRAEALRLARIERGNEFRDLQLASEGVETIAGEVADTSRDLEALAVSAAVVASDPGASSGSGSGSGGGSNALMLLLLVASAFSAALAMLPMGARAFQARHHEAVDMTSEHRAGVADYVLERLPVLEQRRVELAGVSAACLLVAVLVVVGLL